MKFFDKLKALGDSKKPDPPGGPVNELYIRLNDKIQPVDRDEVYEAPLERFLAQRRAGEIVNIGTMQTNAGEVEFCDIDIAFADTLADRAQAIADIIQIVESQGAPQGSYVLDRTTGKQTPIGRREGIGVYLNGTDLAPEVYQSSDVNVVVEELRQAAPQEQTLRYWQGPTETALYFYGASFEQMKEKMTPFLDTYPLCQKCRIVKLT